MAAEFVCDAKLALGRPGRLAAELELVVAEHPLRALRGKLRSRLARWPLADALAGFQEAAAPPSSSASTCAPARRELELRILGQDPGLDLLAAGAEQRGPRRRLALGPLASSGDLNIAYQVTGDGPIDLVLLPGFVSHLETTGTSRATRTSSTGSARSHA